MELSHSPENQPVNSTLPTSSSSKGINPFVAAIVGVALLVGGYYLGSNYQVIWSQGIVPIPSIISNASNDALRHPLFGQVQQLMQSKYLNADELQQEDMLYGAIAGMVSSAGDPYTSFFDPEQNEEAEAQLSGQYEGIGAELGYNDNNQLTVIAPIKDSPALEAGILAGDVIVQIDETDTQGMSLTEAVSRIRGEAGTDVTLVVLHQGDSTVDEITITRQQITIESIELTFEDNPGTSQEDQDIAYLKLSRFGDTTDAEWDAAVNQIIQRQAKALVLDLRNNPGGYLHTSINIGSEFFADGNIVGQRDASGQVEDFSVRSPGKLQDIPVVVLINGGSASASEIVAGALQSRDRALIIGQTSFGKGTVQEVVDLPKGTSLHVTVAEWVLPNGDNIHKQGISPDKEIEVTAEDFQNDRDPQLDEAFKQAGQSIK